VVEEIKVLEAHLYKIELINLNGREYFVSTYYFSFHASKLKSSWRKYYCIKLDEAKQR
jgi:hypothetical protein